MAFILPNGKELKRGKGIKNKLSPPKLARAYKKLMAILFDISEISVSRQFSDMKLSLRNPYAVREYIERKLEYNGGTLGSRWKTVHKDTLQHGHTRRNLRRKKPPQKYKRTPIIMPNVELGDVVVKDNKQEI